MIILGIETSCDETAVALYSDRGLLSHALYSQIPIHQAYGGVVPELASRDHIRKFLPLLNQALKEANIEATQLTGVAYTRGPGLIGALLVGATLAKSLAFGWNIPALGIHHLEAHLMAVFLEPNPPAYPFVALLVSGGHTMLIHVRALSDYTLLGETLDDAAGEAFDKTAKLLGLPYPGGPELAKLAEQGDPKHFHFPRPMLNQPNLDFSFSGLKTHVRQLVQKELASSSRAVEDGVAIHPDKPGSPRCSAARDDHIHTFKADVARAFEEAVIETLLVKSERALALTNADRLVVVGGVSANQRLRAGLQTLAVKKSIEVFYPAKQWCTDNAAMVAYTGWQRMGRGECDASLAIQPLARWPWVE